MYQNLVRSVRSGAFESIHHCAWPVPETTKVDEVLLEEMALSRQVSSLGLSARNSAGLKVRQPLSKALVYAGKHRAFDDEYVEIVKDELNVKALEFVKDPGRLVTYHVLPDNKQLGPRFGARFPALKAALAAQDPAGVARTVEAGAPLRLEVEGQFVELAPEEILVQTRPSEGLVVAADRQVTVALETEITPDLRAEGLAREIVRRVQAMRKDAGFEIDDRITLYYLSAGELEGVFKGWAGYIQSETLSTRLVPGEIPAEAYGETHTIDGLTLKLAVQRN
jgi:isoleucyl-tRNA synthetase